MKQKIQDYLSTKHLIDGPDHPYFRIDERWKKANLTIPNYGIDVKNHIPNLAKAAYELISRDYTVGYNTYGNGVGFISSRFSDPKRKKEKNGFILKPFFAGPLPEIEFATLEDCVESISKKVPVVDFCPICVHDKIA